MSDGFNQTKDGVSPVLKKLLSKASDASGALARIYPLYQKLQTDRFMTENSSEGNQWPNLTAVYERYKPRRYGGGPRRKSDKRAAGVWQSWPGGGRKMLIGTSTLAGAVIGPGAPFEGTDLHRALFTPNSMQISVETGGKNAEGADFDYPKYVAERRPFFQFSDASIALMKAELSQFLLGGG